MILVHVLFWYVLMGLITFYLLKYVSYRALREAAENKDEHTIKEIMESEWMTAMGAVLWPIMLPLTIFSMAQAFLWRTDGR